MEKQEQLGAKISTLRKKKGMTQAELGEELNISYQAVSKWERGESYPDFDTISKMAKIFGVELSYFEKGGATKTTAKKETEKVVEKEERPVGTCKTCGRLIMKAELHTYSPQIQCKHCHEKEEKEKVYKEAARREAISNLLKKSFIWGTIVAAIFLILTIISISGAGENVSATIVGGIVLTVLAFFFTTQMFWDGAVYDVASSGGKVVGTPGIIFSFDLDGFIFLIAMKLLFAVIRFIIWLVTILFFGAIGAIISPFTFIPALKRVREEGTSDTDFVADQVKVI